MVPVAQRRGARAGAPRDVRRLRGGRIVTVVHRDGRYEFKPAHFALYREAVLKALHTGEWVPFPDDHDVDLALWRLRTDGLVEWERGRPSRTLTAAGRLLAERLVAGG